MSDVYNATLVRATSAKVLSLEILNFFHNYNTYWSRKKSNFKFVQKKYYKKKHKFSQKKLLNLCFVRANLQ